MAVLGIFITQLSQIGQYVVRRSPITYTKRKINAWTPFKIMHYSFQKFGAFPFGISNIGFCRIYRKSNFKTRTLRSV